MYYTYVLLNTKKNTLYLGFTKNLKMRMELHRRGILRREKDGGSLKLIYLEACLHKKDAQRRDKYLNGYLGKRYLKNRLRQYFSTSPPENRP